MLPGFSTKTKQDPTRPPNAPPSLSRRCGHCACILTESDVYCPDCTVPVRRDVPKCPRCCGIARYDDSGALFCFAGCSPVRPSANEPRSGWELVCDGDAGENQAYDWSLLPLFYDSPSWDRYADASGRLHIRWGFPDDAGVETTSTEGARLAASHREDSHRIDEMTVALDAFRGFARTDARIPRTGSSAIRTLGSALCIELVNAISARGGAYRGLRDVLRHISDGSRVPPFAGYRHALAFAFGDHGSTVLGDGSPLGGIGGAEALFKLSSGLVFNTISVSPSHVRNSSARNVGALLDNVDVWACIRAARIGGKWQEQDEGDPDEARICLGGRGLLQWELALVAMCQGVETRVDRGRKHDVPEWRFLTVDEAVDRIREKARKKDASTEVQVARHLTTREARIAIRAAKTALVDAFEAWGLIPERRKLEEGGGGRWRDDREHKPPMGPVMPRRTSEVALCQ